MMYKLRAEGKKVIQFDDYESFDLAVCELPEKAARMIEKSWDLNAERHYTASARMMARAEELPGFKWVEPLIAVTVEPYNPYCSELSNDYRGNR